MKILRVLVAPDVPEAVDADRYRLVARARLVVMSLFATLNLAKWAAGGHVPGFDRAAYGRFLWVTLPLMASVIGASLWSLRPARSPRALRRVLVASLAPEIVVALAALSISGSLTGGNVLFLFTLIVAYRLAFDARIGLLVMLSCLLGHALLVGLEAASLLPAHAGYPARVYSEYATVTSRVVTLLGYSALELLVWALTGWTAYRIRSAEHALERINEELEERVQRQVVERSKELAAALALLSQQTRELAPEQRVDGRYRIVCRLGAGGMGVVYEVERTSDRARLALKTLHGRADAAQLARFAREAQIAATLRHPNLVPVIDVGIAEQRLFMVMPLFEEGSLERERARFGDAAWARPLLFQIASGLTVLHQHGIVHRDLKPGNVLLSGGVARIADFGLARLRDEPPGEALAMAETLADDSALSDGHSPSITRAGDLFGTPRYMAPELLEGARQATPSADLFAFGVLACELLTGRAPFAEPPLLARKAGRPLPQPTVAGVDALVVRCLAPDPASRPTAAEVVAALSRR